MLDDSFVITMPLTCLSLWETLVLHFSSIQEKFNYITHLNTLNLHKFSSDFKCRQPRHVCYPSFAWSYEANVVPVKTTRITVSYELQAMIMENLCAYNFPQ